MDFIFYHPPEWFNAFMLGFMPLFSIVMAYWCIEVIRYVFKCAETSDGEGK